MTPSPLPYSDEMTLGELVEALHERDDSLQSTPPLLEAEKLKTKEAAFERATQQVSIQTPSSDDLPVLAVWDNHRNQWGFFDRDREIKAHHPSSDDLLRTSVGNKICRRVIRGWLGPYPDDFRSSVPYIPPLDGSPSDVCPTDELVKSGIDTCRGLTVTRYLLTHFDFPDPQDALEQGIELQLDDVSGDQYVEWVHQYGADGFEWVHRLSALLVALEPPQDQQLAHALGTQWPDFWTWECYEHLKSHLREEIRSVALQYIMQDAS